MHLWSIIKKFHNIFMRNESLYRSCGVYQLCNLECFGFWIIFKFLQTLLSNTGIWGLNNDKLVFIVLYRNGYIDPRLSHRHSKFFLFFSHQKQFDHIIIIAGNLMTALEPNNCRLSINSVFCLHFIISIQHQPSAPKNNGTV